MNFGTRFEERRGPNASETEIYYELNHEPGWIYPVSYQIPNGETTKTLWGGNAQYQNNIVGRLTDGGYYKGNNTINETNFIVDYKWTGSPRVSLQRPWYRSTMRTTTATVSHAASLPMSR